jgi:hypothetical protein
MQEAQEVEVLRLSLASGTSAGSCKASKLNDPSLVGMKLQRELLQSFAKLSQEPLGVPAILEANKFGRFAASSRRARGEGKPEHFLEPALMPWLATVCLRIASPTAAGCPHALHA